MTRIELLALLDSDIKTKEYKLDESKAYLANKLAIPDYTAAKDYADQCYGLHIMIKQMKNLRMRIANVAE